MKTLFKTLIKIIALVILLAILTPIVYFAYHQGQPLSHPDFNGLTYNQFVEWRSIAYHESEVAYQVGHPEVEMKYGICEAGAKGIHGVIMKARSFGYTVSALRGAKPYAIHQLPEDVTISNFLPKWWETYEYLLWYNEIKLGALWDGPPGSVCIIHSGIPTPEGFDAMKVEYAVNASERSAISP